MPDLNSWMKTGFLEIFNFFFWFFRHNRHFFRQNGQKFFIVEKLSFKLWSQFHNGAAAERNLCASKWEIWRNDRFSAFFSKFDPSHLNTYDELVENFLHAVALSYSASHEKFRPNACGYLQGCR